MTGNAGAPQIGMTSLIRCPALALVFLLGFTAVSVAADGLDVKIGYLRRPKHLETISLVQMPAPDDGPIQWGQCGVSAIRTILAAARPPAAA